MNDKRDSKDVEDYKRLPPGERDVRWLGDDDWNEVRLGAQEAIRHASSRGNKKAPDRIKALMKKPIVFTIAGIVAMAVIISAVYLLFGSRQPEGQNPGAQETLTRPSQGEPGASPQPAQPPAAGGGTIFDQLFGYQPVLPGRSQPDSFIGMVARVTLRLALAALLAGLLAYRPRKDVPIIQRNPYVAQSQILLAIVASALMMIVADNAARAFGIFAAASMVRFRTTVRDPKEITVLLVSLGVGLATGVGRWELAVILGLFVLVVLWVLEYYEPEQVTRTMELTVTTRDVDKTDEALKEVFEKHDIGAELRKLDHPDNGDIGKIQYLVNVIPRISTDQLSEEIFSADSDNIDGISWDQKKSKAYLFR